MSLALVLGGGGVVGIAWETGVLAGLRQAGLDLSKVDLIVGTSAGSVVGAQVATGCDLDELYARVIQPPDPAVERAPAVDIAAFTQAYQEAAPNGVMTQAARARLGALALAATHTPTEASRLETIQARLPIHVWPDRRLLVTAVDALDGGFVVWDKSAGVPLPLAVASSCAVPLIYPPMTINGRRYLDGGVRSATNADLAQGCDGVIILAVMARQPGLAAPVEAEAGRLRANGNRVEIIVPDDAAMQAFGPNLLDPASRVAAAQAGFAQAAPAAATLRAVTGPLA
jgi:NTE family protein